MNQVVKNILEDNKDLIMKGDLKSLLDKVLRNTSYVLHLKDFIIALKEADIDIFEGEIDLSNKKVLDTLESLQSITGYDDNSGSVLGDFAVSIRDNNSKLPINEIADIALKLGFKVYKTNLGYYGYDKSRWYDYIILNPKIRDIKTWYNYYEENPEEFPFDPSSYNEIKEESHLMEKLTKNNIDNLTSSLEEFDLIPSNIDLIDDLGEINSLIDKAKSNLEDIKGLIINIFRDCYLYGKINGRFTPIFKVTDASISIPIKLRIQSLEDPSNNTTIDLDNVNIKYGDSSKKYILGNERGFFRDSSIEAARFEDLLFKYNISTSTYNELRNKYLRTTDNVDTSSIRDIENSYDEDISLKFSLKDLSKESKEWIKSNLTKLIISYKKDSENSNRFLKEVDKYKKNIPENVTLIENTSSITFSYSATTFFKELFKTAPEDLLNLEIPYQSKNKSGKYRLLKDIPYKSSISNTAFLLGVLKLFSEGLGESLEDVDITDDSLVIKEPTQEEVKYGISDLLNSLIKSEYDAITEYNNAIVTITAEQEDSNIINVLKDILEEENIHVGQLQKALKEVSEAAYNIDKGEKEAKSQLAQ